MHFNNLRPVVVALVIAFVNFSHGANIMFYFGLSSYSHRISVWPLVEGLAARNHSITFVSPFPSKSPLPPGVTDYLPKSMLTWLSQFNEAATFFKDREEGTGHWTWFKLSFLSEALCTVLMDDPDFVDFVKTNKFDMVVVDSLANECAFGWSWLHGSKLVLYNTANIFPWYVDSIGFPDESSWLPDIIFYPPVPGELSLVDRARSLFIPIFFNFLRGYWYFPRLEGIIREKLAPDFPSAYEIEKNASLILVNTHYGEDYARPFPPNVISVGGMYCSEKVHSLPKEITDFLSKPGPNQTPQDGSFIYISFGSYAEITHFPQEVQNVLINTVIELGKSIKILWKIGVDRPKELPDYVYTSKWMPQQAIMAHPKIRAFVTHAGLLGIHEAICNSVPLIAFPIFAEQDHNANKLEWRKVGVKLEITTITEDKFKGAVQTMLNDQEYSINMKKLSSKFRDRPTPPVDTAIWWTEYVLRHEDTNHLRPLSVLQPWWKKRQLDIWFLVFLLSLVGLKVLVFIIKVITKKVLSDRSGNSQKEKKLKSS